MGSIFSDGNLDMRVQVRMYKWWVERRTASACETAVGKSQATVQRFWDKLRSVIVDYFIKYPIQYANNPCLVVKVGVCSSDMLCLPSSEPQGRLCCCTTMMVVY